MDQLNACFLWILITFFMISELNGFNLEPRVPIVKQGTSGSYFGYSVAQHITEVGGNRRRHARILVGAPKDKGTGRVYKCEITTNETDCQALDIEQEEIEPNEDRTDQWLGVTVRSQKVGGFAMACAHRHVKTLSNARWGLGRCFSLTSSLDYDETWTPCEGRSTSKAHEEFGYCQAGISAQITEDDSILFGSPGPYTWRGTVFGNSVEQGIHADRQWYLGPLDKDPPVDKYSYLGMSVTSGRFFGKSMSYIGGAPRSNGTGQVVFFKKVPATPTYEVQLVLSGDTFASSFGYEVLSIDLNQDSFLDLVVGAPFYYGKDAGGAIYVYMNDEHGISRTAESLRITGKPDSRFGFSLANLKDLNRDGFDDLAVGAPYEGNGVVYIYLGSDAGILKEPSQIIRAEDLPGSPIPTFGYALSGGMDLDGNEYPDLLIGAYEADRVMLLRARPIINIETKVEGELFNIDPNKRGCSGDRYSNRVCFTVRTCLRLVGSSSTGQLKIKYGLVADTFGGRHISRVILKRAKNETYNVINETIELSSVSTSFVCTQELVYLQDNTPDILTPIKFKLTYSLQQNAPTPDRQGFRMLNIDSYPILNQKEAIKIFQVTFAKDCAEDICRSDLSTSAVIVAGKEGIVLGVSNEILLNIDVSNSGESAYEAFTYVTHSSSLSYVGFKFYDYVPVNERIGHCSHENKTLTICSLGNPFKQQEKRGFQLRFNPSTIKDREKTIKFQVKSNSTSLEVTEEPDVIVSSKIIRRVELRILGGDTKEQVFYGGEIRGESAMKTEEQVGSQVDHKYHVLNKGPWKVETITVEVDWPYEVENGKKHGKWLLYLIEEPRVQDYRGECKIDRKRVNPLRLTRPSTEPNDNIQSDAAAEYRESDAGNGSTGNRRKRDARIEPEHVNINGKDGKVVTLDCLQNTAKCFKFHCHIYDLRINQTAIIVIRARLWNSTFVEDYPDVDYVRIQSRARIQLDPEIELEQDTSDDHAIAETKAYPDIKIVPTIEDVPIWIIIVSVCAGVLLLIIIILLLWKFGFFRRKKHEAMMKGNLEKQPNDRNNVDH